MCIRDRPPIDIFYIIRLRTRIYVYERYDMKFGFYLPNHGPTARPGPLAEIAKAGDVADFDCMVVGDHIIVPKTIDSPYPYTVGGEFPGWDTG